jgi:hypothetical protein
MNEPKRLLVGGSPAARALLQAGKSDAPPPLLMSAIVGALGATVAPPVAGTLISAVRQALASKVSVGALALATASGAGYAVGRVHERSLHQEPAATATVTAPAPPPTTAAHPSAKPTAQPIQPTAQPIHEPAPIPIPKPPVREATPLPVPTARPPITEELTAIRNARSLVVAGSGQQALDALDAYEASHPQATFEEEALALRVRACRLTGDAHGAEQSLRSLETRFPGSVHLAGLR